MYDQISSNKWKSWGLIIVFILIVLAVGFVFAQYTQSPWIMPVAVVAAIAMTFSSYYYSDRIVLAMSQARPAEKPRYAHLINSVEGLAIASGIPAPKVYVIDDTAPNAFATGRDPEHGVICVTTGLLQKLNRIEVEGVIAHEMGHIKNYDIRFATLVAVLVGIVALLSDWMLRSFRFRRRSSSRDGGAGLIWLVIAIVFAILAPITAALMQAALSRRREYLADASGALLTRYPKGLADALEKIAADPEPLGVANKATAHLYIYNPLKDIGGTVNKLFSTHPPIEERVRRLRAM